MRTFENFAAFTLWCTAIMLFLQIQKVKPICPHMALLGDSVNKIPMVVIEVEIKGVEVFERGKGVHVQLKVHVLEHKIQPHLLQLIIRTLGIRKQSFLVDLDFLTFLPFILVPMIQRYIFIIIYIIGCQK